MAGSGAVLRRYLSPLSNSETEVVWRCSEHLGPQTMNMAEYTALIRGLEAASHFMGPEDTLLVQGDSKLVVSQVTGAWKVKEPHLHKFHEAARNLLLRFGPRVSLVWHSRTVNREADWLSNHGMDGNSWMAPHFDLISPFPRDFLAPAPSAAQFEKLNKRAAEDGPAPLPPLVTPLTLREPYDIPAIKRLLRHNDAPALIATFACLHRKCDEPSKGGTSSLQAAVTMWLNHFQRVLLLADQDGRVESAYTYGKNSDGIGRLYGYIGGTHAGLQNMPEWLRAYSGCHEKCLEVDLSNAFPKLIWQALADADMTDGLYHLRDYVNDRERVLKLVQQQTGVPRSTAKITMLAILHGKSNDIPPSTFVLEFKRDVVEAARRLRTLPHLQSLSRACPKDGSFISRIAQDREERIILSAIEECRRANMKVAAYAFDGFYIEQSADLSAEDLVARLNRGVAYGTGCTFSIKKPSEGNPLADAMADPASLYKVCTPALKRIPIVVQGGFEDKAERAGAVYDRWEKKWHIPAGHNLVPFDQLFAEGHAIPTLPELPASLPPGATWRSLIVDPEGPLEELGNLLERPKLKQDPSSASPPRSPRCIREGSGRPGWARAGGILLQFGPLKEITELFERPLGVHDQAPPGGPRWEGGRELR